MKSKIKEIIRVGLESFVIAGIALLGVLPFSCKVTAEGIKLLSGDFSPPVLNSFSVEDEFNLRIDFSEKVTVTGNVVSFVTEEDLLSSLVHSETKELSKSLLTASGVLGSVESSVIYTENPCVVKICLKEKMQVGQRYEMYGCVKDENGNSLTFAFTFLGYNDRIPDVIITEIQSSSLSQTTKEKTNGYYRNEFVEILCLTDGNLSGVKLSSAYDGETKAYVFPSVEVKKGEIVVVHMRNRGNGCISEIGNDLNLSMNSYSSSSVRDLWSDCKETALGNKTDIVILQNTANGKLLDAVMYRDSEVQEWSKKLIDYALIVGESGIYESGEIDSAFVTAGLTDTKTISRINAFELQKSVLAGNRIDYPLKSDKNSWIVGTASPGTL